MLLLATMHPHREPRVLPLQVTALLLLLMILLTSNVRVVGGQQFCDVDKFWTPKNGACDLWDVAIPYTSWECRTCPASAVQYVSVDGVREDEACMCNPGFRATAQSNRCLSYRGNPGPYDYTNPPVFDSFTCDACRGRDDFCPGKVTKRASYALLREFGSNSMVVQVDEFYEPDASSVSGYRRKPDAEVISICGTPGATNPCVQLHVAHSARMHCKIYGQVASMTPSGTLPCQCPANSKQYWDNSTAKKVQINKGDIFWNALRTNPIPANVWNLDVLPNFGLLGIDNQERKYFGYCMCNPGYYRATWRNFFEECIPCEQGSYCLNGNSTGCENGWTTGMGKGAQSPSQCNRCKQDCQAGSYCAESNAAYHNQAGEACRSCPPGRACPYGGMKVALLCNYGTYQDLPNQIVCKGCPSGTCNPVLLGATQCQQCPPGKYSLQPASGNVSITECTRCIRGKYSFQNGSSQCNACYENNQYQDEEGQTGCKQCPKGYQVRAGRCCILKSWMFTH